MLSSAMLAQPHVSICLISIERLELKFSKLKFVLFCFYFSPHINLVKWVYRRIVSFFWHTQIYSIVKVFILYKCACVCVCVRALTRSFIVMLIVVVVGFKIVARLPDSSNIENGFSMLLPLWWWRNSNKFVIKFIYCLVIKCNQTKVNEAK